MSLETCVAAKLRMKSFATHHEFNQWIEQHGKYIRLIHLSNTPNKEGWRVLATYQEVEQMK